jgi:hypothetical protein
VRKVSHAGHVALAARQVVAGDAQVHQQPGGVLRLGCVVPWGGVGWGAVGWGAVPGSTTASGSWGSPLCPRAGSSAAARAARAATTSTHP